MKKRDFGAVRQLPSGRWQAKYRHPQSNQFITAPSTFPTRGDADRWLANTQADLERGSWIDPSLGAVTLEEYATLWMEERILAPRSAELYRGLLRLHIIPVLGRIKLCDLSPRDVRAWHAQLCKSAHPGRPTVAKAYRLLRTICETAVNDEMIPRNPCKVKGASTEHAAERPVATVAQVEQLYEAMEDRYKAMVLLAAWCSPRLGEVLALTRRDVDLKAGTVRITKAESQLQNGQRIIGPPKTKAGVRTVSVPPHVIPLLEEHLRVFSGPGRDGLVFVGKKGGPLRRVSFYAAWLRATKATGLDDLRFHDLRHTGATLAAATGASTKELMARLGHASAAAALRYQHATVDRDQAIARALSGLVLPKGDGVRDDGSEDDAGNKANSGVEDL
jgi:integrase